MAVDEQPLWEKEGQEASGQGAIEGAAREEAEAPAARPALGTLLAEAGLLTGEQVREALADGARTKERLGEVLLRHKWVSEADLGRLVARQWQLPFLADEEVTPNPSAAILLPPLEARRLGAFVSGFDEGQAVVALADPSEERLERVCSLLGPGVAFVVVTQGALARLLARDDGRANEPRLPIHLTEAGALDLSGAAGDGGELVSEASEAGAGPTAEEEHAESASHQLDGLLEEARGTLAAFAAALEHISGALRAAAERAAAAEQQLADSEQRLAAESTAREGERARLAALESELEERNRLFATVRAELSELSGTLEPHR